MNDILKQRAARLSVLSNSLLVAAKLAIGLWTGSVSILSEAVHSGLDLVAAGIAWFSVLQAGKPADDQHRFGHGKYENVAGTIEALLIFVAALFIMWEAARKLVTGSFQMEHPGLGAVVMGLSALANYLVSRHLTEVAEQTDSVALHADAMHLRTDVYTTLGVFCGLLAIQLTGLRLLDPLIAMVVGLMIVKAAWDLIGSAFAPILDAKLPEAEEIVIREVIGECEGLFLDYHKLRTRKSGHVRQIDMHLVVPKLLTVEAGHALSHCIIDEIKKRLPNSQVLVHIEPCSGECPDCANGCPSSISPRE